MSLGIGCSDKSALWEKKQKQKKTKQKQKSFFLIWMKSVKKNSDEGGIWLPHALFDHPSAFLSNKVALLFQELY